MTENSILNKYKRFDPTTGEKVGGLTLPPKTPEQTKQDPAPDDPGRPDPEPDLEPVQAQAKKDIKHGGLSVPDNSIDDAELEKKIKEIRTNNSLPPFPTNATTNPFFNKYIDVQLELMYSLREYHFAILLALSSMALGRKVCVTIGDTPIFPNVFVVGVGHTTISGKSFSFKGGMKTCSPSIVIDEFVKHQTVKILRGTISEARLIQNLSFNYNHFWYWDDCRGFFDDLVAWNGHMLGTLCSIYDGEPQERSLSNPKKAKKDTAPVDNTWTCPEPFVSLAFNMTTKDLEEVATRKMCTSGFFPRILWFVGEGGVPRKNVTATPEQHQILVDVANQLKTLKARMMKTNNEGVRFKVNDPIEDWKMTATADHMEKDDEMYRAAIQRGFIHAYKIAMILTMTDPVECDKIFKNGALTCAIDIPDKYAKEAIALVEKYFIPRMLYVESLGAKTDSKNHQLMVMAVLDKNGGAAPRAKILRDTNLNHKDLDNAIETLRQGNRIEIRLHTEAKAKRPTTWIFKT